MFSDYIIINATPAYRPTAVYKIMYSFYFYDNFGRCGSTFAAAVAVAVVVVVVIVVVVVVIVVVLLIKSTHI